MKKKSTQRIAAWLLAAGMMAGTFAQPMAVYAESTASIAASDSTTGDSITADADVVIATPTPVPDTGTDTTATPVPTADSQTPQDPASTAAPETTPAPDAAEDTADDAADTDDTTDTTTTVTPADLQSCIALLAASQLSLDADSIEPDVREETLALSDEITETEPSTLQAVVNAAVYKAPADQTDIKVDVPAGNYTGTLVIPDATIVVKDASKVEIKSQQTIQHTGENEETNEIRYRLTDLTAGTYTLAETKAPLGYAKDPVKYKLTITDRDKNGNILPTIALEDDKGILLYTAVMTPDQEMGGYSVDVTAGANRNTSTASAVMTAGSCLETMPTTEQEQSNLPIRTQISMKITDSYLFSLPFTGGSGMNRSLLQGVAVMALAAAAFAVTAIHRKKKNHS